MAIGTFLASMDLTIVLASYASIGSELNELQSTSWISTGYMLTLASFQHSMLTCPQTVVWQNERYFWSHLLFAYVVFALGSLACGLARNMTELIAAREFAGIGGGGMSTVVSIVMSDLIPVRSRGTWQGLINIVWATGAAIGAPLGGILANSIGWRWVFLMQTPLTMIALMSVSLALHLPKPEASHLRTRIQRIDFSGAFSLVTALLTLLIGLDRGGNIAWDDNFTVASLTAFAVSFILFVLVEVKIAKEPFAPMRVILNRGLIPSYLCNFFGVAAQICTLFYLSLYIQAVRNKSAADAGVALIPSVVASVVASLSGGIIIQATGKYYALTVLNYALMMCGNVLILLCAGTVAHSLAGLGRELSGLAFMAFGNGGGITTTLVSLIAQAGPADQAIATAVSYLFRSLGSVLGLSIGSTLFQVYLRRDLHRRLSGQDIEEIVRHVRESLGYIDKLEPEARAIVRGSYEGGLRTTFGFCAALAGCAFLSSLFIQEKSMVRR
ncbi:MFS general substrate transporter [Amylostereum chailletii]|nr:MFS general substrate transporter [Amylostereum chailletii]